MADIESPIIQPAPVATPRGVPVEFHGPDDYHACWFPIALSHEVATGQVIGTPFLDGRVVVYRTSDGAPHVLSAYCRHLGADLSVGCVVEDKLQCAFHRWEYGANGRCVNTAAGDPPPPRARLFAYPTAESLGIIWAFNGESPSHPAPHFPVKEEELVFDAFRNPIPMLVDSAIVFLNSFDIQHFRAVHKLAIDVDPSTVVEKDGVLIYSAKVVASEFGATTQDRILWGTSTVTIDSAKGDRKFYLLHALCPVGPDKTQGFLVNATPRDTGPSADGQALEAMLADTRAYSLRLVNEDAPIFDTIHFRKDSLIASDRFLSFGMRYISRYPRAHPGREMIR